MAEERLQFIDTSGCAAITCSIDCLKRTSACVGFARTTRSGTTRSFPMKNSRAIETKFGVRRRWRGAN